MKSFPTLQAATILAAWVMLGQAALAVGDPPVVLEREYDYRLAHQLIEERRFAEALSPLERLRKDFPDHAEVFSLTGFVLRKSGHYREALEKYEEALKLDPRHLGANEYLGELFVETGRMELAKERLSILQSLCGTACEEARDLAEAIADADASRAAGGVRTGNAGSGH